MIDDWRMTRSKLERYLSVLEALVTRPLEFESIFYQVEGSIVGGIKMLNINFAYPPSYCTPDKFYEALIREGMPFTVTFQLKPFSFNRAWIRDYVDQL